MRLQKNFAFNPELAKALNNFEISQGNLFHYTKRSSAQQILDKNELWITRANNFLDDKEIKHGISILKRIAKKKLKTGSLNEFLPLVNIIKNRLLNCYILSLTSDGHNNYLAQEYAHGETKIEFPENFPMILADMSWHALGNGSSGYSIHHTTDLYDSYEGFVEYETSRKDEIAAGIVDVFQILTTEETHFIDQAQFVKLLIMFVCLVKESKFREEKEYRIILVKSKKNTHSFEEELPNGKPFIRLKLPTINLEVIEIGILR